MVGAAGGRAAKRTSGLQALKVLKAELAAVVGAERFLAEIETTAKLTHPHILPLFRRCGSAVSFTPMTKLDEVLVLLQAEGAT